VAEAVRELMSRQQCPELGGAGAARRSKLPTEADVSRDAGRTREEQERPASAMPDAALRVYPERGHALAWEGPELVVHDLKEFVSDTHPAYS
jgi:hypothetical protein